MLRANLQSITWYRLSRSLHRAPGIVSLAMRLNYFFLLRWRNWVTVTIMHNIGLAVSQASLQEITATWCDANWATGEKLPSPLWGKSLAKISDEQKWKKNPFVATKALSQSSLKLRGFCAALLIFFVAVSERRRRENEVWLEGLCSATVRRKREPWIQLVIYCKCALSRWT